jgi:hypothetical protein
MLSSPVPAKMTWPELSMATAPIASDGSLSLSGVHVTPLSELRQTPPPALPAYTMAGLVGLATRLVMRPEAFPYVAQML